MSYFRGKVQNYDPANDRFNITLLQALLYRPTSGTIKNIKNSPLVLCARGPAGVLQTTSTNVTTPVDLTTRVNSSCPPISLSDIATQNGAVWRLKTGVTILPCQTLIIPAGQELQTQDANGNVKTLTNNGTITNNGVLSFYSTATFSAHNITNNGTINNNNTINNLNTSYVDNYGTIYNNGLIDNTGTIINKNIIKNVDHIHNYAGRQIINEKSANIYIYTGKGKITNDGIITNDGKIYTGGSACGGSGTIVGISPAGTGLVQQGCPP